MKHSFGFLALAAFSCCICMFCSCSDDIKDENGKVPTKYSYISADEFANEIEGYAWEVKSSYGYDVEAQKIDLGMSIGGGCLGDFIFSNGSAEYYVNNSDVQESFKFNYKTSYDPMTGKLDLKDEDSSRTLHLIALKNINGKKILWLLNDYFLCSYELTTEQILKNKYK